MRGVFKRVRIVDVAAASYAAAFFVWLAIRTPGTPSTQFIGDVAFYPLGLAVAWANWRTASVAGLDARTRSGWYLLSLSSLILWVSGTVWSMYSRAFGPEGWPTWVDHLEVLQNLLTVAAFLVFPGRGFAGRGRARFLLDAGLTVVAGFLLALFFGLRLFFTTLQQGDLQAALTGPGIDWLVFVVAAVGFLQKRDRGTRASLLWFVLAGVTYLAANYLFTSATYGPGAVVYRSGDAVDGLWFAAWGFRWIAARRGRHLYTLDSGSPGLDGDSGSTRFASSGFSYVVVAGTFVLLTAQVFSADDSFLPVLAFSSALAIGLLVARQMVELGENNRLFTEQVAQEARFRSLVQHSSDIVLVVDPAGTITYASPTAARLFGEESAIRPGSRLADSVREDDRAAVDSMLSGAAGPRSLQLRMASGRGEWREVEALWSDLRTDPAVNGIVVNCRDVTERNEFERQLRHTQRLDAVGQLAGGLAHDLNNALAIVSGYADLLRAELPVGSPAADDLAHVQQAVDRAASVTRKVLAFSRRQPAQHTAVELNALIQDLVPLLRQSVKGKVDLQLRLEAGLPAVRADRGQMEQVLVNLATNARDAMPDGGVLEIATSTRVIDAVAPETGGLPPGEYVSVVVKDTGTGISPDVLGRIFEPFFSTKGAGTGMGLGLAMVHGIVIDSGGRVIVDSAVGLGSSFTILLPRTESAVAAADVPGDGPERTGQRLTVLLVDDEQNVRAVARRILERDGCRVIEAAGGAEALAVVEDSSVELDLLVTDLVMPGIHGRHVIARCETLRPSLPIVCMTGYAGEGEDPRDFGKNLVALLSKPFSSDALKRAVRTAAAKRGAS